MRARRIINTELDFLSLQVPKVVGQTLIIAEHGAVGKRYCAHQAAPCLKFFPRKIPQLVTFSLRQ
jgi:hypothetical protein